MKKRDSNPERQSSEAAIQPPRVILLGASNLTRGISTVVETARLMLGGPMDVYAALGHGRSFGMRSRVLVRSLPGILECGLWETLENLAIDLSGDLAIEDKQPHAQRSSVAKSPNHQIARCPTYALITDIGNDVMYGASPQTITEWVEECAARLAKHNARLIITPPPLESVHSLRPWKYTIAKAALFPTRPMTYEQAMSRTHELHERIIDLAARLKVPAIALPGDWYGFDPIHLRRYIWPDAWWRILSPWIETGDKRSDRAKPSASRWAHLRSRTPVSWRLLGMERGRQQPSGKLADGTRISLF